jgi:hypothetical protein
LALFKHNLWTKQYFHFFCPVGSLAPKINNSAQYHKQSGAAVAEIYLTEFFSIETGVIH